MSSPAGRLSPPLAPWTPRASRSCPLACQPPLPAMIAVFALAPRLSSGVRKILETSGRGTAKYLVASIARETVVRDTRYNSLFDSANGSAKAARSVSLASTASEPSPKWKAFVRFSPLVRKDEWCLAWIFAWINPSDTEQAERESPGDVQPRLCVWGMALGEEILRFLQPFLGLLAFAIVYKTCVHLKRKIWIASHQRRFAGRAHLVSHLQLIQRDLDEEVRSVEPLSLSRVQKSSLSDTTLLRAPSLSLHFSCL